MHNIEFRVNGEEGYEVRKTELEHGGGGREDLAIEIEEPKRETDTSPVDITKRDAKPKAGKRREHKFFV